MTIVNSQITDAVAPTAGSADESQEQATRDAIAAQQQFYILAQAATTQGIAAMYSIDTAATADAVQKQVMNTADAVKTAAPEAMLHARDFAKPQRAGASDIAREMDALGEAFCRNLMRVVQIAATSASMTAMIAQPDKIESYQRILEIIKQIV
jgi:hypothetical protein